MALNIILWIIFGALAGWIASLIMRTDAEQGAIANIIIGIVGAFIGGAIGRMLGGPGVTGFNIGSVLLAILGSIILIFFIRLLSGGRGDTTTRRL
jgi:uncharacterized membrane protein YeaQ/YmgE (transglycosylase-associated protein family)